MSLGFGSIAEGGIATPDAAAASTPAGTASTGMLLLALSNNVMGWRSLPRRVSRPVYPHPEQLANRVKPNRFLPLPAWVEFTQTYQQGYRVADTSKALYELYVGEDTPVDFSASGQPVSTSATLPFSWTPTPPASGSTKVLYLVVRQRNAYNLASFNTFATRLEIDSAGAALGGPLTAPKDVATYDVDTGEVRVIATYLKDDDASPADTWELYATVGSDPTPGSDSPAFSGTMEFVGNQSVVSQVLTGYTAGDVLHVIATAKRASDSERASASAVQHTLAASLDLSTGQLFGGGYYEQR